MQKKPLLLTLLVGSLLVSACSHTPVPLAESYPFSKQQRMQAVHHWDVLAEHVATRIQASLPNRTTPDPVVQQAIHIEGNNSGMGNPMSGLDAMDAVSATNALYINPPKRGQETDFGVAFGRMLRNQLVRRGIMVTTNPDGVNTFCTASASCKPMVLDYDIQVVHHKDRDASLLTPGLFSASSVGVWLIAQIVTQWQNPEWAVAPIAVALDLNAAKNLRFPGQTNTEVAVTTSIMDGDLVVYGETNVYYINEGDDDQYEKGTQTYRMVSK